MSMDATQIISSIQLHHKDKTHSQQAAFRKSIRSLQARITYTAFAILIPSFNSGIARYFMHQI